MPDFALSPWPKPVQTVLPARSTRREARAIRNRTMCQCLRCSGDGTETTPQTSSRRQELRLPLQHRHGSGLQPRPVMKRRTRTETAGFSGTHYRRRQSWMSHSTLFAIVRSRHSLLSERLAAQFGSESEASDRRFDAICRCRVRKYRRGLKQSNLDADGTTASQVSWDAVRCLGPALMTLQ